MNSKINKSYLLENEHSLNKEKLRLTSQANILYQLDLKIWSNIFDKNKKLSFLDVGCGNGHYLDLFSKDFSEFKFNAIERNSDLSKIAKSKNIFNEIYNLNILESNLFKEKLTEISPDVILLRFVVQHFSFEHRVEIFNSILSYMKIGSKLIIIDPDDSKIQFSHFHNEFNELIDNAINFQKNNGGDRTIGSSIISSHSIFKNLIHSKIFINEICSTAIGVKSFFEIFSPIWCSHDPVNLERGKYLSELSTNLKKKMFK